MIRDAEIRRRARVAGVEPRTIKLDYALGWALRGIAGHPLLARCLVFKGGACVRKYYFPDYRPPVRSGLLCIRHTAFTASSAR